MGASMPTLNCTRLAAGDAGEGARLVMLVMLV